MRATLVFLAGAVLYAQDISVSTRSVQDLNGNREAGLSTVETRSKTVSSRIELARSVNGGFTPLEQVEERVIKEDATGRVVERIVRRFDANGNPGPPEKTITEEEKHVGGSTVRTTVYRGDLNGNMAPSERSVTEIQKGAGASLTSATTVEQPGSNGNFEAIEKKSLTRSGEDNRYEETAVTYRKGENGFYAASQVVTQHSETNGHSVDQSASYEAGQNGQLELHGQAVTRTSKNADGSQVSEVDRYGDSVAGTVNAAGSGLKLREREVVERRPGTDGSVIESVSVRRPSVSDPGVLGPVKVVSETVCRGRCLDD